MLWKVVFIPSQNKAIAVYLPNTPVSGSDIMKYQISVSQLETNLNKSIPLPASYNKNTIDKLDAADFGSMIDKKQNSCDIKTHVE